MKKINYAILAILAVLGLSSCEINVPQGRQQGYGRPMPYGQPMMAPSLGYRQMPPQGYRQPGIPEEGYGRGQASDDTQVIPAINGGQGGRQWYKITSEQDESTPTTGKVGIQIEAFAPREVRNAVASTTYEWCRKMHHTQHVWPTKGEASTYAKAQFKKQGYNLIEVKAPAPNGFMIVRYDLSGDVNGPKEKIGDPRIAPRVNIEDSDVPQSILDRSRSGKKDAFEPFSQGERTERFIGPGELESPQ
jgi:hypothetical protein